MKKKYILRGLFACSVLCSGNVLSEDINPGTTTIAAPGVVATDYDFLGGNGTLAINANVTYTGNLLNATSGTLQINGGATDFKYAGNTSLNVAAIDMNNIRFFRVDNPNGITTITGNFTWDVSGCDAFVFHTPTIVTQTLAAYAFNRNGITFIGSADGPSSLTFRPSGNIDGANIYPSHIDSELVFDSTNSAHEVDLANFGGNVVLPNASGGFGSWSSPDASGRIKIIANNNDITINNAGGWGWGSLANWRLQKLTFEGNKNTLFHHKVATRDMEFNTSGNITFTQDTDMGANTQIDVIQNTNLAMQGGKTFKAEGTTLNLNSSAFTLSEGNLNLTGDAIVNLEFDDDALTYGKIAVGGGAQNANLDLSGLKKLGINFTATTANINTNFNNQLEFSFPIFDAGANGSITNIPDHDDITFNPTETNLFMSWAYNPVTYTISSTTIWDGLLAIVAPPPPPPAPVGAPAPAPVLPPLPAPVVAIVTEITNSAKQGVKNIELGNNLIVSKGNKAAVRFIQFLGTLGDAKEVREVVQRAYPSEDHMPDDGAYEADEALRLRLASVNESNSVPVGVDQGGIFQQDIPNSSAGADGDMLGYGIAAGDDLSTKHGLWATPFFHRAFQKKVNNEDGYKVNNFGNVLGIDTKINETTTIGVAWGYLKSLLKMSGRKAGSKGQTTGNIFFLYGTLDFPKNFFMNLVASHGISTIRRTEKRILSKNITEFAKSKYKSKLYSAEMVLGKNIHYNKQFTITPTIGIKYTEYHDGAFKEKGTLFQNYNLTKRKYSDLDSSFGMKFSYKKSFQDYKIVPHVSGTVFYNLKDNPATTFVTSDMFTKPVMIKGNKRLDRAWYSIITGVDLHKDNMEYSVEYERQIDKKYAGHQVKIKAKVNF